MEEGRRRRGLGGVNLEEVEMEVETTAGGLSGVETGEVMGEEVELEEEAMVVVEMEEEAKVVV